MKKQQAFLFDMDGVIVDSEAVWEEHGREFEQQIFGKEILEKIGDATGTSLARMYDQAVLYGFSKAREEVVAAYDDFMESIYEQTTVTPHLEELVNFLKGEDFGIGIVSSSRRPWIDMVLRKIPYKDVFDLVLSLDEANLPSKPSPAGYVKAMEDFGVEPERAFVLEDSNAGITAGKASGAFTIAFTQLLVKGYPQISADAKASSLDEVMEIVRKNSR